MDISSTLFGWYTAAKPEDMRHRFAFLAIRARPCLGEELVARFEQKRAGNSFLKSIALLALEDRISMYLCSGFFSKHEQNSRPRMQVLQ